MRTETVETSAKERLGKEGDGVKIHRIALTLDAKGPGLSQEQFDKIAAGAKAGCPLSKALASVPEITLTATLVK